MTQIRFLTIIAGLALATTLQAGTPTGPKAENPAETPSKHSFLDPIEGFAHDSILHPTDPFQLVPGKDPNGWGFVIEPYLWAMGLSGDVGVKGLPPAHVDLSTKKLLQYLDWGVMGKAEIRKGRWGILGDGFFAQMSADGSPPGPLYENASLKVQQGMAELALAYRIIDDRRGFLDVYAGARYNYFGTNLGTSVDSTKIQNLSTDAAERITSGISRRVDDFLLKNAGALEAAVVSGVGADLTNKALARTANFSRDLRDSLDRREILRVMGQTNTPSGSLRELLVAVAQYKVAAAKGVLTSDIANNVTSAQQKFSKDLSKRIENALPTSGNGSLWWVDPIVGLRGQINFTRWLFLAAQADVGGFGAGSQIAWNAQATVGVNFTRNIFAELGYRYFYMNYDNGSAVYNAAEAGLFSGIGVKF